MSKKRITFTAAPSSTKTRTHVWVHDRAFTIYGKGEHQVYLEPSDTKYKVSILIVGNPTSKFTVTISAKSGKVLKTYSSTIGSRDGYPIYDDFKVTDDDKASA